MEVKHVFCAVSSKYLQLTLAAFPMPLSAADVQLFDFQRLFFVPSSAGLVIFSANPPPIPSAVCFFDDRPDLPPRRPPSLHSFHPQRAVRGRPNVDWGQDLLHKIYRLSGLSRRDVGIIAQDRRRFHLLVERLCSLADQS